MQKRRMLLLYPRFANNHFLNFEYMAPFYPGKRAVMPSLGLLTFAAVVPDDWEVRLGDENVGPISGDDWSWAEVVAISGMHPQRRRICQLLEEANRRGKITVLGGPSVTICPEFYPQADVLHLGELGDATGPMLEFLKTAAEKPARQLVFRTATKTPLEELPLPAFDRIDVNRYLVLPTQFSIGCPYTCEFRDIPVIYGRTPRVKSPSRVVRELQAIYDTGFVGTILFVDDNLIAHRKALLSMLPEVIAWQKANRYPYALTGEASVNISRDSAVLQLLHDARLTHLFLGVESPDETTLDSISKKQNTLDPVTESVRRIQSFGVEVIMGMIFGFDTDREETGRLVTAFVRDSNAPIVYFNLLAALPKTALWTRLEAEGRLLADPAGDPLRSDELLTCLTSNVAYQLPNPVVEQMLLDTVREVYSPAEVYRRFAWNTEAVYGKQIEGIPPVRDRREQWFLVQFTLKSLVQVFWEVGVRARYRSHFWRFLGRLVRLRLEGRIPSLFEVLLRAAPNAHHLIEWGRVLREQASSRREVQPDPRPAAMPAGTRPLVQLRS